MNDETDFTYCARTRAEHEDAWKRKWLAWSIGLPSWILQHAAAAYNRTRVARALRIFEPLGIGISILALLATMAALWITLQEISAERIARAEERRMRQATLLALAYERIHEARRKDINLPPSQKQTRAGQIPILEEMVHQGVGLDHLDGSCVNLASTSRRFFSEVGSVLGLGVQLSKGRFWSADFSYSNLAEANFSGAELSYAQFRYAFLNSVKFEKSNIRGANFSNADLSHSVFRKVDLSHADFIDTNLSHVVFLGVTGLRQSQLDEACIGSRSYIHIFDANGNPEQELIWKGKTCAPVSASPSCSGQIRRRLLRRRRRWRRGKENRRQGVR